jgi:peroxiredoxin
VVLAVSEDDDINLLRSFLDIVKPNFPVLIDDSGTVADAYKSFAVPEYFLINKDGIIVWRHAGLVDWNSAKARSTLKELMK